jgi:hypothetical protein
MLAARLPRRVAAGRAAEADDHASALAIQRIFVHEPTSAACPVGSSASAYFAITGTDVLVGAATTCPTSSYLEVTPPNDFSYIKIAAQIGACGNEIELSPVEPTTFGGG